MARTDPHSYADTDHVQLTQLDWAARVFFDTRRIVATLRLGFVGSPSAPAIVDLDTRALQIRSVKLAGADLRFTLDENDVVLGERLRIELPPGAAQAGGALDIAYEIGASASALQWLRPSQTAGGVLPFLFTQCQAIHARSLLPLQDSPRVRIQFRAELWVPVGFRALMAAREVDRKEVTLDGETWNVERWEMPEPIPPYLFAFAVGDLESAELGPRSRVWAEPSLLAASAHEFAETDAMLCTAEKLFGPYDWERFDLLVMPPSFPYGGMENPRLTFLTPSLLAGDRSLAAVVAHELAHSWTGNLVSGASAEHFWLNEGMTVWAERRIVEALFGRERAELDAALGRRELHHTLEGFADRPQLTTLRTSLDGIDPDEVFSLVPYEKGYAFVRHLEEHAGREAFDRFVARYVKTYAFQSITTDEFLALVRSELPGALHAVEAWRYVDAPGLPDNAPRASSARLSAIEALGDGVPDDEVARGFSPAEWQIYLAALPRPYARTAELQQRFHLLEQGNLEIRAAFLELALASSLPEATAHGEQMVGAVGRMKYLKPLYAALARLDRERTRATFERLRDRYHPIAVQVISGLLA